MAPDRGSTGLKAVGLAGPLSELWGNKGPHKLECPPHSNLIFSHFGCTYAVLVSPPELRPQVNPPWLVAMANLVISSGPAEQRTLFLHACEYVRVCTHMPQHACGGQRTTYRGQLSPSSMWKSGCQACWQSPQLLSCLTHLNAQFLRNPLREGAGGSS